jgi:hypothetical protein
MKKFTLITLLLLSILTLSSCNLDALLNGKEDDDSQKEEPKTEYGVIVADLEQIDIEIDETYNLSYILNANKGLTVSTTDLSVFSLTNNKILGVLSICEYSIDTLCIYSLIAPEFRNNHIFSTLFDMLQKNLKTPDSPYKHLEFHLPCTNNEFFNPAVFLLNTYNFNFSHEEYLLSYSLEENSSLKTISNEIDVIYDNSIQEFTLWINDNCIGGCMIYSSEDDKTFATIYDYEIVSKYQGKGYGKIGLYLI